MAQPIWTTRPVDLNTVAELAYRLKVSPLLAHLLLQRGVRTPEEAIRFLYPRFEHLHDPMRLPGMKQAVQRLARAIDRGERVTIYGDYDVDGTTATALLIEILSDLGAEVDFYIPERESEGYGVNAEAIRKIRERGTALLLTVDCGITAREPLAEAARLGIDVIVTDHHAIDPERIPDSERIVALIDPKLPGSEYPFSGLAGVGLAFKIAQALLGAVSPEEDERLLRVLDLVALGTVADMAEIRDENRVLAKLGMEVLSRRERLGVRALAEVARLREDLELSSTHIGFVLGPRINAAGRLSTSEKVVRLLTTSSEEEAREIAELLDAENRQRREIEQEITREAIEQIERRFRPDQDAAIVVAKRGWHPGVVGIVASRLVERYWRPVVVIALDEAGGRGSGRSIPEFHMQEALLACGKWLEQFGGHAAAGGLSIRQENLESFRRAFLRVAKRRLRPEDLYPKLYLDAIVPLDELSVEALEELSLLEPFGEGNPSPTIGVRNLRLLEGPRLMGAANEHLSAWLTDGRIQVRAVHWQGAEHLTVLQLPEAEIGVAGRPRINEYNDRRSVEIVVSHWEITPVPHRDQGIFPGRVYPTWVKISDRRSDSDKRRYLVRIAERGEPALFYVRDGRALEQAMAIFQEAGLIGRVVELSPEAAQEEREERTMQFLEGAWSGLLAVEPVSTQEAPELWSQVRHVVICHPPRDEATFLQMAEPTLLGWGEGPPDESEVRYVHLLFNARDLEVDTRLRERWWPDREQLRAIYQALAASPEGLTWPQWKEAAAEVVEEEGLQLARRVFEELGLIRSLGGRPERIQAVRTEERRELDDSPTYREAQTKRLAWKLHQTRWAKWPAREFFERLLQYRRELLATPPVGDEP
ncbi:MAG: hypothetical protein KatS3mg115_0717 [Candidatus Poribacteria bacterium]|nr:MAG: hypothetical protein KatS3mg115_0717 [Candidatus Poribacteria bacterium]